MGNLSNEDIKQFLDVLFKRGFEKGAKKVINDAAKELVEKVREEDKKSISYEWQEPPHVFVPSYAISPFDYISDTEGSMDEFRSLTHDAQNNLLKILQKVKWDLKKDYVPIVITCGSRDSERQRKVFMDKILIDGQGRGLYLYDYYRNQITSRRRQDSPTLYYLRLACHFYDGMQHTLSNEEWVLNGKSLEPSIKNKLEKISIKNNGALEDFFKATINIKFIPSPQHLNGQAADIRNWSIYKTVISEIEKYLPDGYYQTNHLHAPLYSVRGNINQ